MANNPKKMADPTEAALSAIQEALNSQDQNNLTANHQDGMSDPFSGEPNESEQTANVAAADSSLIGSGDLADLAARAANDDQQSIGQVLQSLQRRPARASYLVAALFSGLWIVGCIALSWDYLSNLHGAAGGERGRRARTHPRQGAR